MKNKSQLREAIQRKRLLRNSSLRTNFLYTRKKINVIQKVTKKLKNTITLNFVWHCQIFFEKPIKISKKQFNSTESLTASFCGGEKLCWSRTTFESLLKVIKKSTQISGPFRYCQLHRQRMQSINQAIEIISIHKSNKHLLHLKKGARRSLRCKLSFRKRWDSLQKYFTKTPDAAVDFFQYHSHFENYLIGS